MLGCLEANPRSLNVLWIAEGKSAEMLEKAAREAGVPVRKVPVARLRALVGKVNHQGVVASCSPYRYADFEEILALKPRLVLCLDQITDPQNLGSLSRSAEVLGAAAVVLPKDRSAPVTGSAARVAAGALARIKVARVVNLARALEELKREGYWTVGLSVGAKQSLLELRRMERVALVVGGEHKGLRPSVARACDFEVSIPMLGQTGSLNAACAGAIGLFWVSMVALGEKAGSR